MKGVYKEKLYIIYGDADPDEFKAEVESGVWQQARRARKPRTTAGELNTFLCENEGFSAKEGKTMRRYQVGSLGNVRRTLFMLKWCV